MSSPQKDWNGDDDLFNFTRGRFVTDEAKQMAIRRVQFDMNELAQVAAKSIGASLCVDIEKCPDGLYNKAYIFTMDNGHQVIGKVPNPNAGVSYYTTASEVATMDFMRTVLGVPVPAIHASNFRAESSPVGAEFIIMEKVPGIPLRKVWASFKPTDKLKVFLQVFRYQQAWATASFDQFGSLYYAEDLESLSSDHLSIDSTGGPVRNSKFTVGPAVGREWVDKDRGAIDCDRGPWNSLLEYRKAVVAREVAAVKTLRRIPDQIMMLCGPKLYEPTTTKKLEALGYYLHILEFLLPTNPQLTSGHLWHNDLHDENIFVDPEDPTQIRGIIDWQSTQISPLFDNSIDPSFLSYEGPEVGDNLDIPELPDDYDSLHADEKCAAMKIHHDHCVMVAWRRLVRKKSPAQYNALQFRKTTAAKLLTISRRIFEMGETHLMALLLQLKEEWKDLPAVRDSQNPPPFPLHFSEEHIDQIERDFGASLKGMDIMSEIEARLGSLWPENGTVGHEQYEDTKAALRKQKKELMSHAVDSDEDRVLFEKFWPFDD